ncbi:hypothetical protein [Tenacibaculum maritimum]|uniref:hypothetical protein n=1 Tax=Tenacibaculum maritimum TaxID=107401 RepID=UPI0010A55D96|nr:hypothetical protein [Tenacibaculum maritimum]MCD9562978.1 hypothetical protein [Tenacibaculum maritimum]MCD9565333.1 hypothetical protein [Tenacibaculum maritimum]MCD9578884.1 hypothetical protein [Tenacibaculum maritimum]MCD9584591.1 hypothetical protein [Tenacibaculum maritimum]MCD9597741.1 hypothetical protein [Tenacibaculum maritimum]
MKNILKIISLFLVVTLLAIPLMQWEHYVSEHIVEAHVYSTKKSNDKEVLIKEGSERNHLCSICDYTFSGSTITLLHQLDSFLNKITYIPLFYVSFLKNAKFKVTFLRGPPSL